MEKKEYERIKAIRNKVKARTATFAERNWLTIYDKRRAKNGKNNNPERH